VGCRCENESDGKRNDEAQNGPLIGNRQDVDTVH
jgi:hypothetical protein